MFEEEMAPGAHGHYDSTDGGMGFSPSRMDEHLEDVCETNHENVF
jgi:hypothetical protein